MFPAQIFASFDLILSFLKTDLTKGSWYIGLYNNGGITQGYSITVSQNDTRTGNYVQSSEEYQSSAATVVGGSEKSSLVWVVSVLSALLLISIGITFVLVAVVLKQSSSTSDKLNWQSWQNDDL